MRQPQFNLKFKKLTIIKKRMMKTTFLKRTIIMLAVCTLIVSCEKKDGNDIDDEYTGKEQPGNIPGFGENGGSIAGQAFQLPAGLEFAGDIMGYDDADAYTPRSASAIIDKRTAYQPVLNNPESIGTRTGAANVSLGSGLLVTILIPLKNTTSNRIDVEFPAGLIFESSSGRYQNGILLKKTKATVPANSTYYVSLHLYCGNASRSASSPSAHYLRPVVTNSELLLYLCGLVKNKKINIEENQGMLNIANYVMMAFQLQQIVWKVTDYGQLPNQEDLDYIAALK
jgi:hypothetical protein